jgi:succinate dehydrogenase/fumarate reductase iron-sulfur protein
MTIFKLRIQRSDPTRNEAPHHEVFEIDNDGELNIIQAIRHIYENTDGSLAFRNTDCRRGVCGLCSMMIDGKRRLACMCVAKDGVTIEPPPNRKVIKDLVFQMD